MLTCDGLGVRTVGAVADQQPYRGARWYEMRETAATLVAVSYTHLTLPTRDSVKKSVVAVSLKKKNNEERVGIF